MIIATSTEEAFHRIQHPFMIALLNALIKLGIKGSLLNMIENINKNP